MPRRLVLIVLGALLLLGGVPAAAQQDHFIDVVKVSGPLDDRMIAFATETINDVAPTSALIILQLDSPAAVSGDIVAFLDLVENAPAPLAVWVGPETAVAYGGAVVVLEVAPIRLAAPGTSIGARIPLSFGLDGADSPPVESALPQLDSARITVTAPVEGLVDEVHPALANIVQALDGRSVVVGGEERTLEITRPAGSSADGERRPITTRFHEQGFVDRALRLSLSPAIAYLFLLVGLSVAAFEFYAAGVGVAAAVSVLTIFLSGYGLAVLPVNWWAVGLGLLGLGLYLFDFQRIQLRVASILGTGALLVGGRFFVYEPPQLTVAWWSAVMIVVLIALFFLFAMTTVVRARFSTPTIGREHLIGKTGIAETAVTPEGIVVVDGARWKANSRRASGINPGDPVVIAAVEGIILEVDPVENG